MEHVQKMFLDVTLAGEGMKEYIHPVKVAKPPAQYTHGVIVHGERILFVSGQVGRDPSGKTVQGESRLRPFRLIRECSQDCACRSRFSSLRCCVASSVALATYTAYSMGTNISTKPF